MNFGCGDMGEGAVCSTKYTLHSKHPLKQSVSFSSRKYSIYSFAQLVVLAQHWGKEFWMLALGFPLFSFPFPFINFNFYSKTCRIELYMVGLLAKFISKSCTCEVWMARSVRLFFLYLFSLQKIPCK